MRGYMRAGKLIIGDNVGFERTRRITGYLVGTLDRFNDAKRAEEGDRVKHGIEGGDLPRNEAAEPQIFEKKSLTLPLKVNAFCV
jgi:ribonucleoside-triphosphate reductase